VSTPEEMAADRGRFEENEKIIKQAVLSAIEGQATLPKSVLETHLEYVESLKGEIEDQAIIESTIMEAEQKLKTALSAAEELVKTVAEIEIPKPKTPEST
jgi:predicted PilT family ATPase